MRIASLAVLAACLSTTALAADLDYAPLRGTQYGSAAEPIVQWGGGYIGGFAGYSRTNFNFAGTTTDLVKPFFRRTVVEKEYSVSETLEPGSADGRSTAFGAFAGYNVQFDEVVFGVEIDYTRSKMDGRGTDQIGRSMTTSDGYLYAIYQEGYAEARVHDTATLRARVGYTMGSFLPFVTAGVAVGRADIARGIKVDLFARDADPTDERFLPSFADATDLQDKKSAYSVGLAAGAGVDVAVSPNIFLRAEWQYVHFQDFAGVKASVNTARAAAGVKF